MSGKSNKFETELLKLIFNGTAVTAHGGSGDTIMQNGAAPPTQFWVSLHHTGGITDTSDQSTNELSPTLGAGNTVSGYVNYARTAVARTATGFSVAAGAVTLVADVSFPAATNGQVTVGYAAVGTASAAGSTGYILYYGAVSPTISISNGVTPKIGGGANASSITED